MGICIYDNCKTHSNFNYIIESKAIYCAKHKLDGMINIKLKRCAEIGCQIMPCYNYKNNKKGLYCAKHRKDDMINVKNCTCSFEKCNTIANYNYSTTKKPLYCAKHKKADMINVRKKLCTESNCLIEPIYNYSTLKKPLYCAKHKKADMINIKDKNKHCIFTDCTTIAIYNIIGKINGLYCAKHKKNDMIDVKSKSCIYIDCNTLASYNYENTSIPIYCKIHKKDDIINVKDKNKQCKTPLCSTLAVTKKYNGYCFYCYYNLFPDSPLLIRNFKTKEKCITEYILDNFKNITVITDKPIYDGCSKRRPDIFIDLGFQVIIIEIDEDQHISYNSTCEHKRLMEISKDINHRPLILIRFNPDKYIDTSGNRIDSCWIQNNNGIYIINKNKLTDWTIRLNILKDCINKWIDTQSNKTLEIIHLFYNNQSIYIDKKSMHKV
jgi:hypothetical protein